MERPCDNQLLACQSTTPERGGESSHKGVTIVVKDVVRAHRVNDVECNITHVSERLDAIAVQSSGEGVSCRGVVRMHADMIPRTEASAEFEVKEDPLHVGSANAHADALVSPSCDAKLEIILVQDIDLCCLQTPSKVTIDNRLTGVDFQAHTRGTARQFTADAVVKLELCIRGLNWRTSVRVHIVIVLEHSVRQVAARNVPLEFHELGEFESGAVEWNLDFSGRVQHVGGHKIHYRRIHTETSWEINVAQNMCAYKTQNQKAC